MPLRIVKSEITEVLKNWFQTHTLTLVKSNIRFEYEELVSH